MAEGDEPDLTGDLYALVVYLHASCNRDLFDAIGREQLTFNQLQLLERLRGGRHTPRLQQAAAMMGVSEAATTRIVDDLARRGLVRRELDDRDYRAKRIVITDKGEEVIARLHAARLDVIAGFTDNIPVGHRNDLQGALHQLPAWERIAPFRPQEAPA